MGGPEEARRVLPHHLPTELLHWVLARLQLPLCATGEVGPGMWIYPSLFDFGYCVLVQVGLVYVRGCEVEGMLDENGKVIEEGPEPKPKLTGDQRTWRVLLDANQYQLDMTKTTKGGEVSAQEVESRVCTGS